MKLLLCILITCLSCLAKAQEIFPKGCTPIVVHGESVRITTDKPVVIMLHNLSNTELWITHPVFDPGAQAGWSSQLNMGKWSALAMDVTKKPFELTCIESKPGHEQQIPCADVLAVCQWLGTTMPENKSGTFWAGENMGMRPLKAYLERSGFILTNTKRDKT